MIRCRSLSEFIYMDKKDVKLINAIIVSKNKKGINDVFSRSVYKIRDFENEYAFEFLGKEIVLSNRDIEFSINERTYRIEYISYYTDIVDFKSFINITKKIIGDNDYKFFNKEGRRCYYVNTYYDSNNNFMYHQFRVGEDVFVNVSDKLKCTSNSNFDIFIKDTCDKFNYLDGVKYNDGEFIFLGVDNSGKIISPVPYNNPKELSVYGYIDYINSKNKMTETFDAVLSAVNIVDSHPDVINFDYVRNLYGGHDVPQGTIVEFVRKDNKNVVCKWYSIIKVISNYQYKYQCYSYVDYVIFDDIVNRNDYISTNTSSNMATDVRILNKDEALEVFNSIKEKLEASGTDINSVICNAESMYNLKKQISTDNNVQEKYEFKIFDYVIAVCNIQNVKPTVYQYQNENDSMYNMIGGVSISKKDFNIVPYKGNEYLIK